MTVQQHSKLHLKAYEYLYETGGVDAIDNYLKWFEQKYNMRLIHENH